MSGHDVPDIEQPARLATAYAAAHYFATVGHREWLFCVGQSAADIERELNAGHYLFITAWNPPAESLTMAENIAADERLRERLLESGFRHQSALGCNAQGGAVEYGWMVLDMPVDASDALAREFGQAGILYWRHGEQVRLRMLRPRPPEWNDLECVDWVG